MALVIQPFAKVFLYSSIWHIRHRKGPEKSSRICRILILSGDRILFPRYLKNVFFYPWIEDLGTEKTSCPTTPKSKGQNPSLFQSIFYYSILDQPQR